jgi:VWFA-related protein
MKPAQAAAHALTVGLLVAWSATPAAQRPQSPGAIRTAVTLVPVDVRVLDRDGRPVTNLEAGDFAILEDGVPQKLAHFSAETLAPSRPVFLTFPPLRRAAGLDPAARPRHRTFLLVLGRGRLQDVSKGFDALTELVEERLMPQDYVALVAYNRATDFTADHQQVRRVLAELRDSQARIEAQLKHHFSGLQLAYGSPEIPAHIQASIDRAFARADVRPRALPPTRIPDSSGVDDDIRDARMDVDPAERGDDSLRALAEMKGAYEDLLNLYMGVEYLRYVEGEKHIVFVTEQGLSGLARSENTNSLAALAADARVAVHTIQTGGMPTSWVKGAGGHVMFQARTWPQTWAMLDARAVAEITGGTASFYRYATDAIATIDRMTRFQYVLGYSPANTDWNGKYRRIDIRVNRRGLTVLHRRGYFARQELVPFDRRQFLTFSRVMAAAAHWDVVDDIPVAVTTAVVDGGRAARVEVAIDPSSVSFREQDGRYHATLDLAVFASRRGPDQPDEAWAKLELALDARQYAELKSQKIRHTMRVPLSAGAERVKAVVYQYDADRVGSAVGKIARREAKGQ